MGVGPAVQVAPLACRAAPAHGELNDQDAQRGYQGGGNQVHFRAGKGRYIKDVILIPEDVSYSGMVTVEPHQPQP